MEDDILIYRADTGAAIQSINDLKESISYLKEELSDLTIGSEDYQKTLDELHTQQAALKNAMHGTATDMEQIARAAKGQDESYNGLVRTMAKYKEELRAIDTSTAEGMQAFKEKAKQIEVVNDKLKNLDALQGNYQRNVGNYKSALDGLAGAFKATAGSAASVINPVANLTSGLKVLSTTPAIGMLGLLANLLTKVGEGIRSDEDATNSWNRAVAAFKPISDGFIRTMQELGAAAADLANKFVELLYQWGLLDEEAGRHRQQMADDNAYIRQLQRNIDLENANLEEDVSELRARAAERDKYTAQQRLDMLQRAADLQMRIEKNNSKVLEERLRIAKEEAALARNDAETNDKINQLEVAVIQQRVKRNTTLRKLNREMSAAKAEIARKDAKTAEEVATVETEADKEVLASWEDMVRAANERERRMSDVRALEAQNASELDALIADADKQLTESLQAELDAQLEAEYDAMMEERRLMQQRVDTFLAFTSTLSNIAGSLADIYEADAEADERAAQKAKALRTASAIISTIGGAISAFTSTWSAAELPYTAKVVLAPLNAAAVLTALICFTWA